MSHGTNKINRRLFLTGGLALGASVLVPPPLEKLVNVMSDGFIQKAHAEATGQLGSRNYVNLLLAGAPARYGFDHWMRTSASDPMMIVNPMVATALTSSSGQVTGTEYKTFDYKGVLVPHMFSHSVYNGKGQLRPLTDLLDNMMVIRGYGTGMDGHPTNATAQMSPLGGASSIAGLAADYSNKNFQAIQWPDRTDYGNFNSATGKAMNKLAGNKPIANLLEGFAPVGADRVKASELLKRKQSALELAQARLQRYIKSDAAGSKILADNMKNATVLMKKGVGDVDGYWAEALPRYKNLIENSMRMSGLPGLSDKAIISDTNPIWSMHVSDGNKGVRHVGDLRDVIKTRTICGNLAEGFALTEYVLKQGLATSIELLVSDVGNVSLNQGDGLRAYTLINDMHESGAVGGLTMTTTFYRGVAAAVLELADQLKTVKLFNGTDLWTETVFQISSEFSRSARTSGSGSDHGFNQMVTSVYSGMITSPLVVGNIYREGASSDYAGTQGVAAPIAHYNQVGRPTPAMAASTIAGLLRVPKNPFENVAAPLILEKQGIAVVVAPGRIVGSHEES